MTLSVWRITVEDSQIVSLIREATNAFQRRVTTLESHVAELEHQLSQLIWQVRPLDAVSKLGIR